MADTSRQEIEQDLLIRKKRAIFRACHRGTRELDFIIGRFAEAEVPSMTLDEIELFEDVMSYPEPVLMAAFMEDEGEFPPKHLALIKRIQSFHRK